MKRILTIAFAAASLLVCSSTASAAVFMRISDGVNPDINITDGGAGDSNPVAGVITWIGSIGTWTINVDTGFGTSVLGPGNMDLAYSGVNNGGGTLNIWFSETDHTFPFGGYNLTVGGTQAGGLTTTYTAYGDAANAQFGTSTIIGVLGPFATAAYAGAIAGPFADPTPPYSLTQRLTITAPQGGPFSFSGDANLSAVPEPGTMLLFGAGLVGVAIAARRRISKQN